jgi:anti-repressor protein
MNELIKIETCEGNERVNARELHSALEVSRDFSTWIKERLEKYGFREGVDFKTWSPDLGSEKHGGQNKIDYLLSVSTAKEIATVENNEKGREVRRYLIQVEEAWNTPEMVMERAREASVILIARMRARLAIVEPKADFFDTVADSKDAHQMRDVAAVLNMQGWGRNSIFKKLREDKILDERNIPYREYQDRGYFRVVERTWTSPDGESHINLTTLVYQKGIDFIRKALEAVK